MGKTRYIFIMLMSMLVMTSCMDGDWDEPTETGHGNETITETNLVTIAQLKQMYSSYVNTSYTYKQVTEPLEIRGVVTGNDIEGNIYSEIALQDSTGAIIIAISEGGICGYLPVGTEIVVELKDLYVGNYGRQAEIGTPYTNSRGNTYVSRMSRLLWNDHFKYTGRTRTVEPEEFRVSGSGAWDLSRDGGKLGILKDVEFDVNNDSTTYANPGAGSGSKSIYFKTQSGKTNRNVMIYTSNYADFAADYVPTGKVNVTGIVKRYNNYWEFIIRSIDDVETIE